MEEQEVERAGGWKSRGLKEQEVGRERERKVIDKILQHNKTCIINPYFTIPSVYPTVIKYSLFINVQNIIRK